MIKYLFSFVMYVAGFAILLGIVYIARGRPTTDRTTPEIIGIRQVPSVAHVADALVRGYAAKTSTPMRQFVTDANVCNIYFSLAAPTQDAVIARDGLTDETACVASARFSCV